MGKLRRCLRAIKSTVSRRMLSRPEDDEEIMTGPFPLANPWDKPGRQQYFAEKEQGVVDFQQKLVPLRKSDTTDGVSVCLKTQAQRECYIDAVHVQLEPTLFTTYVYETDQSSSCGDICFAPSEDLSNGIRSRVSCSSTSFPPAPSSLTSPLPTPSSLVSFPSVHSSLISFPLAPSAFHTHFSQSSYLADARHESDQYSWVRRSTYLDDSDSFTWTTRECEVGIRPDTPPGFLTGLPLAQDASQPRKERASGARMVSECDLIRDSGSEEYLLGEMIEDMLLDCLQNLPLSAFPLRVPEFSADFVFMASLRLSPIYPLMPCKPVIIGGNSEAVCDYTARFPASHQLPEEEPPSYSFDPPEILSFEEIGPRFSDQGAEIVDLLRIAVTLLHREMQIANALATLEGREPLDSHMSTLLKELGRLAESWPDSDMEGIEAFRDALSDGILLRTFVCQCLPPSPNIYQSSWESSDMSQEGNIRRFIDVYESIVPPRREMLRESSFENISIEELGAYSRAVISIHNMVGGFVTSPPRRPDLRAPDSHLAVHSTMIPTPPTVRNTPVLRPLPTVRPPSLDPPFYCESAPATNVDYPRAPGDVSAGFAEPEAFQLPEEETLLYRQLLSIIRNERLCELLLQGKGEVQTLLDVLHHLLSFPQITGPARSELLTVLIRVTTTTGLYPRSLMHVDDPQVDKEPVTGGGYSEILRGNLQEQGICVKVVRLYREVAKKQKNLKAFMREIALWGQLDHPNILPFYGVYHLDNAEERICLVSPWMENGTLPEYLRSCPDASKLLLARDVALGLEYLHGKMLVHGDLKGANILVTLCGRACLADFGLASVNNTETVRFAVLETTGHEDATPRYEAPELLFNNGKVHRTTASDMYAFGCVCYEIFTRQVPFYEVASGYAVLVKLINGEVPTRPDSRSSPELAQEITDEIWTFITSCWCLNPPDRPSASDCLSSNLLKGLNDVRPEEQEVWSPSKYRSALGRNPPRKTVGTG